MNWTDIKKVPHHLAIIMDGNGRWAQSRGEPRIFGHQKGAQRVREVVELAGNKGVKVLTLYAFSEENWRRPQEEVNALFSLLVSYLREQVDELHKNGVKLCSIGAIEKLPQDCRDWLGYVESKTKDNTGLQLVLALSYGSQSDMVSALVEIAKKVKEGTIEPSSIDAHLIRQHLSTHSIPDPDFLIRTSGEQRLSNFLLWESAYAEFFFTKTHWPDFSASDLEQALAEYARRERRFGDLPASQQ
jgi:undecaprenyl diphosphate synthase